MSLVEVTLIVLIANSSISIIQSIYRLYKEPEEKLAEGELDGSAVCLRIAWIIICEEVLRTGLDLPHLYGMSMDAMLIFLSAIAWNSFFLLGIFLTPDEKKDLRIKIELIRRSLLLLLLFAATGLI